MKSKGFTLIELLAVIVILAIIALIATPIVLNIINEAKDSSNKQSIQSLVRSAELYHASNVMNGEFPKIISLPDEDKKLNIDNAENMKGYISISKRGEIEAQVTINGTKYAKNYNNSRIYNTNKEEYIYDGNPDEWIVSINDSSKLLKYKPIVSSTGTKDIIETYIYIPYYFYIETSEDLYEEFGINKKDTIDKTINELNLKYPGYEYYIPSILKEEINILINKLEQKFGSSITDVSLIDYEIIENYIYELKEEIPVIYDYYYASDKFNLYLSGKKIDVTTVIPTKVNGIEIKSIANYHPKKDCNNAEHCKELYYGTSMEIKNYYFNLIIPEGIEEISGSRFENQQVYSLKLPSTLKTIGSGVFTGNYLTELIIPDSVEKIGIHAFDGNKLKKLKLSSNLTNIESCCFYNNQLEKINIPNGVQSIGNSAFAENPIKEVTIPASVEEIKAGAFESTITIEKLTIEGDATRFNDVWTSIGFPAELMPTK